MFSAGDARPRVGVRIGDSVLDLSPLLGGEQVFAEPSLNAFMAQGRARWSDVRNRITELLTDPRHRRDVEAALHPLSGVRLHLPFEVGDYVDFYASEHHATNVGPPSPGRWPSGRGTGAPESTTVPERPW